MHHKNALNLGFSIMILKHNQPTIQKKQPMSWDGRFNTRSMHVLHFFNQVFFYHPYIQCFGTNAINRCRNDHPTTRGSFFWSFFGFGLFFGWFVGERRKKKESKVGIIERPKLEAIWIHNNIYLLHRLFLLYMEREQQG